MQTTALSSVLLILAIAVGTSCTPQSRSSGNQAFEFSSGGAYHIQELGEWQVKLDSAGAFSITHIVRDEVKEFGTFTLTEGENSEMWQLIRAANIEGLASSQRPGVPDEVQYTFVLADDAQIHSVEIWIGDARENDRIVALVDGLAALIETYAKQKPVLN